MLYKTKLICMVNHGSHAHAVDVCRLLLFLVFPFGMHPM